MVEEQYIDQFTPWMPNHWAGDGQIPVDVFGGAILGHLMAKDSEGLRSTSNLLYASVTTNFYLDLWASNSIIPEEK